jgi:hypothetical protein
VIFVINDGGKLSLKMNFVVQAYKLNSNEDFFYVFRRADSRFEEKWGNNQVDLATSTSGNFMHFLLMLVKSPKNMRDGLLKRLLRTKSSNVLLVEGFLSGLSQALGEYFDKPARTNVLINFLRKLNSPKIFLIDEYVSIRIVNLKILKLLGSIVYVSQDVAYDHFNFGNNIITKTLMYKLERDAVALSDLVVACSERDRLKYLEMGARKVLFYPNIYPIAEFEPGNKDQTPSISIVLRGHWGSRAERSLDKIFKALSRVDKEIRVYMIGIKPQQVPKNIELQHYARIPSKLDYLNTLSKSWIGINIGIHMGGANERKYDYAMAGLVVFSDTLGVRGDLLPHEYTYVDSYDLAAKLEQLLEFGKEMIVEMGKQNRKQALSLAEKQREKLLRTLNF